MAGGFPNSTVALEVTAGLETQNGWTTGEALGLHGHGYGLQGHLRAKRGPRME